MFKLDEKIIADLHKIFPEESILLQEPMYRHTTFKVGGPVSCFIKIQSVSELTDCVSYLRANSIPYFVLGNGSNLLVSDAGFKGVVLCTTYGLRQVEVLDDGCIYAQAGASNTLIAQVAKAHSLAGFAFAAGIPGSIGGSMRMNAGAYGSEMKDVVESVEVLLPDGSIRAFSNAEMGFAYRQSILKSNGGIVLSVKLRLSAGNADAIESEMNDLMQRRRDKQPLEYPSAGSTFKRPEGYFAGKLIQDAGLKGYALGGAQVSEKHSGFVINTGTASATDIYQLICRVQEEVQTRFGVQLQPEVEMLGDFE